MPKRRSLPHVQCRPLDVGRCFSTDPLVVGYPRRGLWDRLHELEAHDAYAAFEAGRLTVVPMTYGIFCATVDVSIAVYCYRRRENWRAAWKATPLPA